ncbi:MAG TPA: DUF4440 domain-containing protein, partial [Pirellulales bacterium]|nr:DUF4440 domain-containing protein [Pirellulales bacterium]
AVGARLHDRSINAELLKLPLRPVALRAEKTHIDERSCVETRLQDLELTLLRPDVRKSDRVAELLADEFIEFGSSGSVFTKPQVMAALRAEGSVEISASQLKVHLLAPDVALVTYRARCQGEPVVHSLRSSIWKQNQGRWQMVFHQGTHAAHENATDR